MSLYDTVADKFWNNQFSPFRDSKNPETPEPSAEETALYQQILQEIQYQKDFNESILPIQMKEQGYKWQETSYTDEQKKLMSDYKDKETQFNALKSQIESITQNSSPLDLARNAKKLQELGNQAKTLGDWLNSNKKTYDELTGYTGKGSWVEMSEDEYYASLNDREKAQYDLNKAQMERSSKALAGELPLSEALIEQKNKEFAALKEVYGITGDTPETASGQDTIATQNINAFQKKWAQIEDAQRYGNSSSSVESAILGSGLTTGQTQNNIGTLANIGSGVGSSAGGYMSMLQPYQFYNQAGYQAQAQGSANRSAQTASLLGLLGYMMSSKKFKENIVEKSKKEEDEALKKLKKTKSYSYKYKKMFDDDKEHIGTLTEESPKEYVGLGGNAVHLGDKVEYLSMSIKSLARKVDKIGRAA